MDTTSPNVTVASYSVPCAMSAFEDECKIVFMSFDETLKIKVAVPKIYTKAWN